MRYREKMVNFERFLLLIVCLALLFACGNGETEPEEAERTTIVEMAEVAHRTTTFPIHTAGMVSLKETIKLSFKVGGIIERIFVDEGQSVAMGQILAQLDLSEIQANVTKAQSAFEKALRDLERARTLFNDRVVTLEQLQDAETAHEIAKSDLDVARFNLSHSTIIAPSAGKILKRYSEQGELIASGTPVFLFASTEKNWIIRFGVIDRDVVRLKLNDPAKVSFDVFPGQVFDAAVSEIAQSADPQTGIFEIELTIADQAKADLVAGFIAKVDVYPRAEQRLSFIPIGSLVDGEGNQGYVFVVNNATSRAEKIPVTVERILDGQVAVSAGLEEVTHVVATGASYLVQGSKVEVKESP